MKKMVCGRVAILLSAVSLCAAWMPTTQPAMWPSGGGGGDNTIQNQLMQMVSQELFGGVQGPASPSPLMSYDTAVPSPADLQALQNLQALQQQVPVPQLPVQPIQQIPGVSVPSGAVQQIPFQAAQVPAMQFHALQNGLQQIPIQMPPQALQQAAAVSAQVQASLSPKTPAKPARPGDGYSMADWIKFVSAGVAAVSGTDITPKDVLASFSSGNANVTPESTTNPTTTTTTTTTTETPNRTKMTLGQLLMSSLEKNKTESTKVSGQAKRGCYYKGQWYKPESEIERGQSGNWCYGTYCNKVSVVIHWDDHKCTSPLTTPPVFITGNKGASSSSAAKDQSQSALQASLFQSANPTLTELAMAGGIDASLLASSFSNNGAGNGGLGAGTFGSAVVATTPQPPPTSTENPHQGCIFNNQWYPPGADITNVREYGRCYGSYCDFKSKIVQWNDRCTATVAPVAMPAPTQSFQSLQRQMQQLESFMKKK